MTDDERWTVTQVAVHLGVKPDTVSSWKSRGQMPAPDGHLGRTAWWRPETIKTWDAERPRR